MAEIIELCEKLIDRGIAYAADGNVWFDVTNADYGKLSNRRSRIRKRACGNSKAPARRSRRLRPLESGQARRAHVGFPWGKGRPGWHIECSAMSMKYLGETFDMHGGGMDLMFPHHENELAQSECCHNAPMVLYWAHNGLLRAAPPPPKSAAAPKNPPPPI